MGKRIRKSKKRFLVIEFILLLFIGGCLSATLYFYNELDTEKVECIFNVKIITEEV